MENGFELTAREATMVRSVLAELLMRPDVRTWVGSITIEDIQNLCSRMLYNDYCIKNNIRYEDMTDDDFMNAYFDKYEC